MDRLATVPSLSPNVSREAVTVVMGTMMGVGTCVGARVVSVNEVPENIGVVGSDAVSFPGREPGVI